MHKTKPADEIWFDCFFSRFGFYHPNRPVVCNVSHLYLPFFFFALRRQLHKKKKTSDFHSQERKFSSLSRIFCFENENDHCQGNQRHTLENCLLKIYTMGFARMRRLCGKYERGTGFASFLSKSFHSLFGRHRHHAHLTSLEDLFSFLRSRRIKLCFHEIVINRTKILLKHRARATQLCK